MATTGKKGGSKMIWIIGGLIVIAGGIGAYFLLRKPKEEKDLGDSNTDSDTAKDEVSSSGSSSGSGSGAKKYTPPAELSDSTKIKAFQDWMDKQGKGWIPKNGTWVLLNKGEGYGNYGENTDNVWKFYGKDYLKSLSNTTSSAGTNPSEDDINLIIKKATGVKSDKSVLQGKPASWVKKWASAIRNNRTTFFWTKKEGGNDKTYKVSDGQILLEYVPVDKTFYASKTGRLSKQTANNSASAGNITKGDLIGLASDVSYDGEYAFIYFPSRVGNKWVYASALTQTKPSSSFDGTNDQIEFSSFDNNFDLNL